MRTIAIDGVEYKLAYNLRSLFTYEEIAGHPYKGEKAIDNYTFLYSMLLANNEGFSMTFDEFLRACDEDLNIFQTFVDVVEEQVQEQEEIQKEDDRSVIWITLIIAGAVVSLVLVLRGVSRNASRRYNNRSRNYRRDHRRSR